MERYSFMRERDPQHFENVRARAKGRFGPSSVVLCAGRANMPDRIWLVQILGDGFQRLDSAPDFFVFLEPINCLKCSDALIPDGLAMELDLRLLELFCHC